MAIGGWPLVFVVPAAVAALAALTTLGLPGLRSPEVPGDFDLAGAVLFGVTIAAAILPLFCARPGLSGCVLA
jgi:hypothetical protein